MRAIEAICYPRSEEVSNDKCDEDLYSWMRNISIPDADAKCYLSQFLDKGYDNVNLFNDLTSSELREKFELKEGHAESVVRFFKEAAKKDATGEIVSKEASLTDALEELDSTTIDDIIDNITGAMQEATNDSFYVVSMCVLLKQGYSCRNTLFLAIAIFALFLQFLALRAALSTLDINAWITQDDDTYPFDDDDNPVNTNNIFLSHLKIGVRERIPMSTFFVLLFVAVSIGASMVSELKEVVGGWCLVTANAVLIRRSVVEEWNSYAMLSQVARIAPCILIQYLRMALILQFYEATIFVVGTSDGQFNVVLNSLALSFVLDFDDAINSYFKDVFSLTALPTDRDEHSVSQSFDHCCRRFAEFVVLEKKVHRLEEAIRIINRVIFPFITIGLSIGSILVQAHTSDGILVGADDGNENYDWDEIPLHKKFLLPSLFVLAMTLAFLIKFLVHEAIFPRGPRQTAMHVVEGLFDGLIVWLLYAGISKVLILQALSRWLGQTEFNAAQDDAYYSTTGWMSPFRA